MRAKSLRPNHLWGQSVRGQSVLWAKVSGAKVSFGPKCLGPKCLLGQSVIRAKVSIGAKVSWAKVSFGPKRDGQSVRGQSVIGAKMWISLIFFFHSIFMHVTFLNTTPYGLGLLCRYLYIIYLLMCMFRLPHSFWRSHINCNMHATYLGWVALTLYLWKYGRKSLWKIEKKPSKNGQKMRFFFFRKAKKSSFECRTVTNNP